MPSILTKAIRANPRLQAALSRARVALLSPLPSSDRRPDKVGPTTDWADARPGIQVPPTQVFRDIRIVPTRWFAYRDKIADGGPVWPDFESNRIVRHQIHDQLVDRNARPRWLSGPRRAEPMIWGGRCLFHFGHLAAEHMNRLPASLYQHPRAPVVFALPPNRLVREVPGYFWAIAAWLGAQPAQIHFITRPFVAAELHVTPQVEQLSPVPVPDWHLDLLDELPRLNKLKPIRNKAVYVQRLGFVGRGQGGHAGERVLIEALSRAGVAILDPGKETLMRQMALYAGARLLIFAEGSAMHGRQLLGRVDQKILVLRRRPRSRMAWAQLEPRCRALEYAPIIRAFAMPFTPQGVAVDPYGMAFYNKEPLFNTLRRHGIDIAPYWDDKAYRQAVEDDAHAWYRGVMRRGNIHRQKTLAHIKTAFDTMGIPLPSG